jgi:hypothetical protein
MSEPQVKGKSPAFLNVLFDVEARRLLGKGGAWVTASEFMANPPQHPEDLMPPARPGDPPVNDPDPGPVPRCIGGQLFVCIGTTCTRVLKNGQPVPCP